MSTTFWIQFLGIIFGLAMLYFSFVKFKRNEINKTEWIVWSGGWLLMILVAIVPYLLDPIIAPLNFYRRLDFFVVLGFFVLLALGFYNYSLAKKHQKRIEKIVKEIAFKKSEEENHENSS